LTPRHDEPHERPHHLPKERQNLRLQIPNEPERLRSPRATRAAPALNQPSTPASSKIRDELHPSPRISSPLSLLTSYLSLYPFTQTLTLALPLPFALALPLPFALAQPLPLAFAFAFALPRPFALPLVPRLRRRHHVVFHALNRNRPAA